MRREIRFKEIIWGDLGQALDGEVVYEFTTEATPEELGLGPDEIVVSQEEWIRLSTKARAKISRINPYSWLIPQRFKKGKKSFRGKHGNVWAWDGNTDAPTLTPCFMVDDMYREPPIRAHLFFTKGKIDLLADSNVKLIQ